MQDLKDWEEIERDYTNALELPIFSNMELLDVMLIQWDVLNIKEYYNLIEDIICIYIIIIIIL